MSTAQEELVVKQDLSLRSRDVVGELKELLGSLPKSLEEFERDDSRRGAQAGAADAAGVGRPRGG